MDDSMMNGKNSGGIDVGNWMKTVQITLLVIGLGVFLYLSLCEGIIQGLIFACIPMALFVGARYLAVPQTFFIFVYITNFYIAGVTRYIDFKSGMLMSALVVTLLVILFLHRMVNKITSNKDSNLLVILWGIWLVYCVGEVFNPYSMFDPWSISINGYGLCAVMVSLCLPVFFSKFADLKRMLVITGILLFTAAVYAMKQQHYGFTAQELHWLYNEGGASTHLLYTGIRYFSFFTDAANFGTAMGFAMVVFSVSAYFVRKKFFKLFCFGISVVAFVGMLLAGTRSAFVIPFVGYTVMICVSKNTRLLIIGGVTMLAAILILNFTTIGESNQYVRRVRTLFDVNDASLNVRQVNKQKIFALMPEYPFGVGLGLGGGKALRFTPDGPLAQIPTDSFFVMLFVETGIVGLVIYLILQLIILGYGAYIVVFRVRDRELRGILIALLSGVSGVMVSCYANEVLSFPNGMLVYVAEAFIFMGPELDRRLMVQKQADSQPKLKA